MSPARVSLLACFVLSLGFFSNTGYASWEPKHCLFEYAKILPTPEMVASLKSFASKDGELWAKIPDTAYQKFIEFGWKEFQDSRKEIDQYCGCAYPHDYEVSAEQLRKRFEENALAFNENLNAIKVFNASYFQIFKDKPEEYQVSREVLLWSCTTKFYVLDFDVDGLNKNFRYIHGVLLKIVEHIAADHGVKVKGGPLVDLHHEVLETGRKAMAKPKVIEKKSLVSVTIKPDSESIAPKFDSSFLKELERAQKEGKGLYSYLEFISGEDELHRYYTQIEVLKGKDMNITGLEVYDPMLMVKLEFPVDHTGKATTLPQFYQAFAKALMTKHDLPDVRQISSVKYKVLLISDIKAEAADHGHKEL